MAESRSIVVERWEGMARLPSTLLLKPIEMTFEVIATVRRGMEKEVVALEEPGRSLYGCMMIEPE